ncbi:GrpB family protein [Cytobacillus gottheilii]|uniref:GrpB family protein n=1 Tax=Cytobacillus gottheilii TaxID=859144 RepID=UPI0009B95312|nr:GrpB family protein [Cytobacillus gottheilii]
MRKVEVCTYNPDWVRQFKEEAEKIRHIFGSELQNIYHIGSTSVKGLSAKPIIDILPIVQNIHTVTLYNEAMIRLGYEPKGENGINGRRYFQKGGNCRTHHVHIFEEGSSDILRHISFRDYLRNHQDIKQEYAELKMKLAAAYPYDIDAYIKGKEQLVKRIERQALQWAGFANS